MGKGNNQTIDSPGYFVNSSTPRRLISNMAANGGGCFNFSPNIAMDVPAYTPLGTYPGTLIVSVS